MSVQTAGTGFERHSTTASRRGPLRREPAGAPDALPPRDASLLQALTIVAHDLRGPLANLSVMLELIEAYTLRQSVGEAQGCARRAQRLVGLLDEMLGGFLERTRTTGDPLAFRPRLLDLSDVLDRALSLSSPVATGRGITLERLGGTSVTLSGDRSLLVEAVDNILGNAVKYAPVGSTVRCVVGREGRDAAREKAREIFGGLDFVSREEFEAVKAMAARASRAAVRAFSLAASSPNPVVATLHTKGHESMAPRMSSSRRLSPDTLRLAMRSPCQARPMRRAVTFIMAMR